MIRREIVVSLWLAVDCVDFVVLEIGFVLQKSGRFVEGARQLSMDDKMGYIVKRGVLLAIVDG